MTSRAIAAEYAKALFTVAITAADPTRVGEELAAFARLVVANPDLQRALRNPAVPIQAKQKVVGDLAELGGASTLVRHFLVLLGRQNHLAVLGDVVAAYEARLLQHLGIVAAEVTSASPLGDEREATLTRILSTLTGKQVRVSATVDPRLIGGVVAKVGSTVYDGSLVRQLQRLKKQMIERA